MSGVISDGLRNRRSSSDSRAPLARQIENRPAEAVIRLYDSKETLFYCDPPYIHTTRGDSKAYSNEMTTTSTAILQNC